MINIPKGTKDVLPKDSFKWRIVRNNAYEIARKYNLKEISTPGFESTELFVRSDGESSDIVNKEMYTFLDKGGRSMTLKPEGTAGVVRSLIENGLGNDALPLKLFYITPCYRYEKPQAGRLREHHQFGVEIFGSDNYASDIEAVLIAFDFYKAVGIEPTIHINFLGCDKCKANYKELIKKYTEPRLPEMCDDCHKRYETNVLRMLDCKSTECKAILSGAPIVTECLCEECNARFNNIKSAFDAFGIKYSIDSKLVRGLDYYTDFVFEFVDEDKTLGQNALGGGGRYDRLVEELGGKHTPVIGFGIGIERLLLYAESKGIVLKDDHDIDVYVAGLTDNRQYVFSFVKFLRDAGFGVESDIMGRSFKAQFKYADKIGAKYVITIGDDEIKDNVFSIKNMQTGEQVKVDSDKVMEYLNKNV